MFPLFAAFALSHPKTAQAIASHWRLGVAFVVGLALVIGALGYRRHLLSVGYDNGVAAMQVKLDKAVTKANAVVAKDQRAVDTAGAAFNGLGKQRTQEIKLKLQPITERIQHEVSTDPDFRDCVVPDSVMRDINAARATVDSAIAASNPK